MISVQAAVLAAVIAMAELAPRPGLATLHVPVLPPARHAALDWALARGAAISGSGPFGGLILANSPTGFGARAFREGALALAIPSLLCQPPETHPHG
ncbi:hypothetical protein NSE01_03060 [Novosphingobium sediminis]|uniref:Uncharacterized protein n=1 Tax=Novosphingobium sediminis TaxID=707214 RepID=A0A512AFK9_9SPHN|nr:hypothetical protein NSE01_03060 [Novosphingobium sediminis]